MQLQAIVVGTKWHLCLSSLCPGGRIISNLSSSLPNSIFHHLLIAVATFSLTNDHLTLSFHNALSFIRDMREIMRKWERQTTRHSLYFTRSLVISDRSETIPNGDGHCNRSLSRDVCGKCRTKSDNWNYFRLLDNKRRWLQSFLSSFTTFQSFRIIRVD